MKDKIFEAKDVVVKFNLRGNTLTAIRGASIELYDGETLAIVGERKWQKRFHKILYRHAG